MFLEHVRKPVRTQEVVFRDGRGSRLDIRFISLMLLGGIGRNLPVAPASRRAPDCANPSPPAPPETRTTWSTRLNSGRRFVVPRNVGASSPVSRFLDSFGGGLGAGRAGDTVYEEVNERDKFFGESANGVRGTGAVKWRERIIVG